MANEKKSIIEEALLEAQEIDAAFKSNAKEILSQTMSSEIEEMVKESLTGSKKRLKEDEEEEELDLDLDTEEGEEEDELDLDTEEGEDESEETEMDLDLGGEEGTEDELDLDLDTEEGDEEMDLDLDLGDDTDLDLGGDETEEVMGDVETVDLTGANDSDVISVFKKMGPEDEIEVVNDNGIVTLKDNKSGSEYRIEMNPAGEVASVEAGEIELGEGEEGSDNVIYEIVVDDDEDEEEMEDDMSYMTDYAEDEMSYMGDKMSYMKYKKSGLKHPEKADLNKDHDITPYEKKRGMAIEKSMEDHMDYMGHEGEDHMDYMSRTLGAGKRFGRLGLPKPKAAPRHLSVESTTPQISKLIKENTNLNTRNSELEVESKELKENYEKMVDALKQFRTKLQEVAVFNSNLTYAVRLFTENTTTKEEKGEILKRLDLAKSLKESQSIYKQLVKEISNSKAPIKETIEEKINNTSSSGALISEQSVFVHPEIEKMKKLWGYSYKK